jgi:hypothetical protein
MRVCLVGALALAFAPTLPASVIFTPEAAGVQQTTVAGAVTETFDALLTGALGSYNSAIGTYSAGAAISAANAFGGANQTQYILTGDGSSATQYELAFSGLQAFFGLYWAAGDPLNLLSFYEGATLKGTFTVADILPTLSAAYFGNPNTGENSSEPYVYLNFTSTDLASRFNRVVFQNTGAGTAFETDNHSVVNATTVIPEPSSWLLMAAGLGTVLALAARRLNVLKK